MPLRSNLIGVFLLLLCVLLVQGNCGRILPTVVVVAQQQRLNLYDYDPRKALIAPESEYGNTTLTGCSGSNPPQMAMIEAKLDIQGLQCINVIQIPSQRNETLMIAANANGQENARVVRVNITMDFVSHQRFPVMNQIDAPAVHVEGSSPASKASTMCATPDGTMAFMVQDSTSTGCAVWAFNLTTMTQVAKMSTTGEVIRWMAMHPDGDNFYLGGDSGYVERYTTRAPFQQDKKTTKFGSTWWKTGLCDPHGKFLIVGMSHNSNTNYLQLFPHATFPTTNNGNGRATIGDKNIMACRIGWNKQKRNETFVLCTIHVGGGWNDGEHTMVRFKIDQLDMATTDYRIRYKDKSASTRGSQGRAIAITHDDRFGYIGSGRYNPSESKNKFWIQKFEMTDAAITILGGAGDIMELNAGIFGAYKGGNPRFPPGDFSAYVTEDGLYSYWAVGSYRQGNDLGHIIKVCHGVVACCGKTFSRSISQTNSSDRTPSFDPESYSVTQSEPNTSTKTFGSPTKLTTDSVTLTETRSVTRTISRGPTRTKDFSLTSESTPSASHNITETMPTASLSAFSNSGNTITAHDTSSVSHTIIVPPRKKRTTIPGASVVLPASGILSLVIKNPASAMALRRLEALFRIATCGEDLGPEGLPDDEADPTASPLQMRIGSSGVSSQKGQLVGAFLFVCLFLFFQMVCVIMFVIVKSKNKKGGNNNNAGDAEKQKKARDNGSISSSEGGCDKSDSGEDDDDDHDDRNTTFSSNANATTAMLIERKMQQLQQSAQPKVARGGQGTTTTTEKSQANPTTKKKQQQQKKKKKQKTALEGWLDKWWALFLSGCQAFSLPGLATILYFVFAPCCATAFTAVMLYDTDRSARSLIALAFGGVLSLLAPCIACLYIVFYWHRRYNPKIDAATAAGSSASGASSSVCSMLSRFYSYLRDDFEEWPESDFLKMFGGVINGYTRYYFCTIELFVSVLIGLCDGVVYGTDSRPLCIGAASVMLSTMFAYGAFFLFLCRPVHTNRLDVFCGFGNCLLALVVGGIAMYQLLTESEMATEIMEVICIVAIGLSLLGAVFLIDIANMFVNGFNEWQAEKQRQREEEEEDEEGVRRHDAVPTAEELEELQYLRPLSDAERGILRQRELEREWTMQPGSMMMTMPGGGGGGGVPLSHLFREVPSVRNSTIAERGGTLTVGDLADAFVTNRDIMTAAAAAARGPTSAPHQHQHHHHGKSKKGNGGVKMPRQMRPRDDPPEVVDDVLIDGEEEKEGEVEEEEDDTFDDVLLPPPANKHEKSDVFAGHSQMFQRQSPQRRQKHQRPPRHHAQFIPDFNVDPDTYRYNMSLL